MERLAHSKENSLSFDIETTAAPLFAVDPQKRIIAWNHATEVLFGLPAGRVMGKHCRDVLGKDLTRLCASCEFHNGEHASRTDRSSAMSVITSATTGTQCAVTLATLPARVPSGNECTVHIVQPVPEYETVTPFTDQFSMREYPVRGNPSDGQMALGCAHLTARELDILRLLACGRSSLEIAAMLQISKATARNHIASILAKFGATTRLQAVTLASRAHII